MNPDPDPGGPKTSGSGTLVEAYFYIVHLCLPVTRYSLLGSRIHGRTISFEIVHCYNHRRRSISWASLKIKNFVLILLENSASLGQSKKLNFFLKTWHSRLLNTNFPQALLFSPCWLLPRGGKVLCREDHLYSGRLCFSRRLFQIPPAGLWSALCGCLTCGKLTVVQMWWPLLCNVVP